MSLISTYQSRKSLFAEKLITKGVEASASDGLTTLINKIDDISSIDNGILLFGDKKIGQSGDEIKFTAVYIEDGKTVSGKEILFDGADTTGISRSIPASVDTSVGNKYAITAIPSTNSFLDKDHYILIYRDNYPKCTVVYKNIRYSGSNFIMDNGVIKYTDNNDVQQTIDVSDCDTSVVYTTGNGFTITDYSESITNDYGVATATYTCNGSGLREVSATSGSFVSETYSITDAIVIDKCLENDHYTKWSNLNNRLQASYDENGRLLTNSSGSIGAYTLSSPDTSTSGLYDYDWQYPYCIDFKITGTSNFTLQIQDQNSHNGEKGFFTSDAHIQFKVTATSLTPIVNGTTGTPIPVSLDSLTTIVFIIANGNQMKFKDLMVYPI